MAEEDRKGTGTMIPGEDPSGSDVERLARDMGWRPEEEYHGDPETWVDAETFIKRGQDIQETLKNHVNYQQRQLADLRAGLEDLRKHNERVYKAEVSKLKKEIEGLTTQRREAIEEGDPDRVEEIEKQLDEMKSVVSETEELAKGGETKPTSDNPEFDTWRENNPWYGKDEEMTGYADAQADNPDLKGLPYKKWLSKIEERVKAAFPEKFEDESAPGRNQRHSAVEGGRGRTGASRGRSKFTRADLTDDQKQIMDRFVRTGALTEEQYIADLAELGEIQ